MKFIQLIKQGWGNWVPVWLLMLIAILIRLRLSSEEGYYLLEGDGPYYPIQVRSLLENYRLALPDVPLLFIIESLFAKLFQFFTTCSQDECILMGIRFVDVFLPPLAAIPVFLISRELKSTESKNAFPGYLMVGFAILNFSPIHIFSQCLHKNAVAVVWVFYYLLFIIRFLKYSQRKHLYRALAMLVFCAMTHFGSFSILFIFSLLFGFYWSIRKGAMLSQIGYKRMMAFFMGLALFICCIAFFDPARLTRLLFIPLTIFEAPLILVALDGQDIASHTNIFNMLMMNLLFYMALIGLFINRRNISSLQKNLSAPFLFFTFLMVSPFLGIEWANRLYMMAYVPVTVLYLVFFDSVRTGWVRVLPIVCFFGLTSLSIMVGFSQQAFRSITNKALSEFRGINNKMNFTENSLLIGTRNLRLLGSWFFGTKAAADYALKTDDVSRFGNIYIIRQLKGINLPEYNNRADEQIPTNSVSVYRGQYFEIYRLVNVYQWTVNRNGIPKYRGVVESIGLNSVTVLNKWSGSSRVITLSGRTVMHLNNGDTRLRKGMYVEVFGKGKPFSLALEAEEIFGNKYLTSDDSERMEPFK